MGAHQCFLLAGQLAHIDFLEEQVAQVSAELIERLRADQDEVDRLTGIPGVSQQIGEIMVAEIGTDMQRFAGAAHLASWAGMCPGNNEGAGKRLSGRTRKGSPALRTALVAAAHARAHSENTYLAAQFRRLVARRSAKKAAVAEGTRS